eukprot:8461915-Pyramimonas_sp.AAC.1
MMHGLHVEDSRESEDDDDYETVPTHAPWRPSSLAVRVGRPILHAISTSHYKRITKCRRGARHTQERAISGLPLTSA